MLYKNIIIPSFQFIKYGGCRTLRLLKFLCSENEMKIAAIWRRFDIIVVIIVVVVVIVVAVAVFIHQHRRHGEV